MQLGLNVPYTFPFSPVVIPSLTLLDSTSFCKNFSWSLNSCLWTFLWVKHPGKDNFCCFWMCQMELCFPPPFFVDHGIVSRSPTGILIGRAVNVVAWWDVRNHSSYFDGFSVLPLPRSPVAIPLPLTSVCVFGRHLFVPCRQPVASSCDWRQQHDSGGWTPAALHLSGQKKNAVCVFTCFQALWHKQVSCLCHSAIVTVAYVIVLVVTT